MFNKKTVFAVVLGLVISAIGYANTASIIGLWHISQDFAGVRYTVQLGIEESITHVAFSCEVGKEKAIIRVDVPSKISGNQYSILAPINKAESVAGRECKLALNPASATFEVTPTHLTLRIPQGQATLTRVQQ